MPGRFPWGVTVSGLHPERARARASLTCGASLGTWYSPQLSGVYFGIQSQKQRGGQQGWGREEKAECFLTPDQLEW